MKFDLTKYEIKKNTILNATYKCIFRQGIAGISMRSIAKEAKVTQPVLHYYFKSKENLLIEFIRAFFARCVNDITESLKPSDPPEKKLNAIIQAAKDYVMKEEERYVVFAEIWSLAIKNPPMQKIFIKHYRDLYKVINIIIEEGVQKGVFNDIEKNFVPFCFMTSVEGIGLLQHMRKKSSDIDKQFEISACTLKKIVFKDGSDVS
jgi:AcrR family transcriptional regulator